MKQDNDLVNDRNYLRTLDVEDLVAKVRAQPAMTEFEIVMAEELETLEAYYQDGVRRPEDIES